MANKPQPWEDFDPTTATASAPWEDFDPYEGVPKVPESENPAITGGKPSTERFAHPDDGIHFNPRAATGAMGIAEMAAPLFQKRAEEGGWGIAPDTAGVFGANVFGEGNKYAGALKPVADLPVALADVAARAVQGGMYGVETAGDLLNKAAEHFGLNKLLSVNGNEFQPGSIAPALAEAFPLFGAESGIAHAPAVPHLPSEAEAAYKQLLNHGTKDEIKGFFADKPGFNVDAATVDKYVEARDAHKNVSDDVQYQGAPSTPEYPRIPRGEIKNDTNRPYTPEEQAIADKLNAEKAGFKPTSDPTAEELFAPKQKATTKQFEPKLEADARAFQAAKAEPEAPPVAPEHVSAIDKKATEVKDGWTNAPEHNVYSSLDDIKDPAVRAAAEKGEAMDRPAFYGPDGQVYLNATKLTPEEVPAAIFHESLGHYGLAQQFRGDLDNVLRAMYDTNVGKYRLAADQWAKANKDAYGGKVTPERALEEVLAEESEKGVINSTVLDRIKNVVKRRAREMGLKMAFSDREITSILADAHRQVTKGKKGDVSANGLRSMYIGVNSRDLQKEDRFGPGIHGLADHVYDFMDDTDLQHAEGRFDPVELRDRYGLHQGPEGGIRSEITDHTAKIKPEVEWDTVPSGERLPLGDVLDHPDLFRNYPDLKDVIVTRQAPPAGYEGVQGWTHEGTINVSPNARKPLSTLLHEVQHIIQDKEGWLSGGSTDNVLKSMNPNQLNRLVSEALKPLKEDLEHFKSEGTPQGDRWAKSVQKDIDDILNAKDVHELGKLLPEELIHKAYQNMFGEIEARDTQARQDLTPDQRRAVLPYSNANDVAVEDLVRTRQPGGPAMSAEAPVEDVIKPMRKREEYVKAGVNTRRISTSNDISGLLREYEKTYVPKASVSFADTKARARDYLLNPNKIAKGLGVQGLDAKVHAYEQIHAQLMDDVAGIMKEVDEQGLTPARQAAMIEKAATLSAVKAGLEGDKGEIARALSAMRILKVTEGKADEFLRVIGEQRGGIAALSDPTQFLKFMNQIKMLQASGNPVGAGALMTKLMKPFWEDYVLTGRHAAMLSGLGTHLKNVLDNFNMIGREFEEAAVASAMKGGMGHVAPQEVAARAYGLMRAAFDTATYSKTWDAFKNAPTTRQLSSKVEVANARIPGASKVLDLLHAEDVFFRSFMETSNLYALGVRQAKAMGHKGVDMFTQGSNFALNPTGAMIEEARHMADVALVVSKPSRPVTALEAMKARQVNMTVGERAARFAAHIMFPFVRVSDRLLFQKIRRTPLAFLDGETRADIMAGGARRDIAVGRVLYGSAAIAYYWAMAGKGDTTGVGPDYKKQQSLEAGGYQPMSVKEGGKYVDATALNVSPNPFNLKNGLAIDVASIREAYEKSGDATETAKNLAKTLTQIISNNSFADNLRPWLDVIDVNSPGYTAKAANAVGGVASSFVPTAVRTANSALIDPTRRDTSGDKSFSGRVKGRVLDGIPGQSSKLPVKYDVYGRPMERGKNITGIDNSRKIDTDPTVLEIQRLEKLSETPVVTAPNASFSIDGGKFKLTGEKYAEYQKVAGTLFLNGMKGLTKKDEWKKLPDAVKIAAVKELLTETRKQAHEELIKNKTITKDDITNLQELMSK